MNKKNSRTRRKLKVGFKGLGTHKQFGIGKLKDCTRESLFGSYKSKHNRTCQANETYVNIVHAAIKHNTNYKIDSTGNLIENNKYMKHIGSKPYNKIIRYANPD